MLNALTVIEGAILQGNIEHQEIKETGMEMQGIRAGTTPEGLYIAEDEPIEFALMAYTSNSSGSEAKSNLEIIAYQLGLESIEAQLVVHQKNEAVYEEKIAILEFEFETSSKNLNKLISSQLSSKDKIGLGYGDQWNENDSSGSELSNSMFDSRSSDGDNNQTNDRFKKDNGYHVVPPPLTGNYMPPQADLSFAGLDDSVYRPIANKTSASVSQVETSTSQTSNTSVEMPRVKSVRPSGVIIEDWVSDDDEDIFQSNDLQATDKPSFKRIEFTHARNESVKPKQAEKPRIITQNPKVDRRDWNGKMTQKLGFGFGLTKKACFVCGSYSHLIKDCDFHEKIMAKKSVLKYMGKNSVLTRSGRVPVSVAKQSSFKAAASIAPNTRISNEKVNTVRVNGVNIVGQTAVSTVKGIGVTAVKASTGCVWRPKMTNLNNVSKDNSGSWVSKRTKIHVDNESAICVVKNPVYHSKTKHIEIRHHFIRDSYEKRLIEMVKIHTDNNVADLLTKAFDGRLMVYKYSGLYTSTNWIEVGRHRKTQNRRRTKKDTKLPQTSVPQDLRADKAVHAKGGDSVERAITTVASLDAAHDSDNIIRTQTTAMPNVDIPQGMDTGGSLRRQETVGGTPAQTRSERVLKKPNKPPLSEGHTSRSGKGRMEHQFELTANVSLTPHYSPLPGGYIPGSDEDSYASREQVPTDQGIIEEVDELSVRS
ncbi:hypothetical protein Tco_0769349 [Tanacetum coccineum]|uniref:Uncharacterized protein n=1 Tax=Tanacetum coccineum TaxID=301880 RepID=A0ABQ4Z971_9ASTR